MRPPRPIRFAVAFLLASAIAGCGSGSEPEDGVRGTHPIAKPESGRAAAVQALAQPLIDDGWVPGLAIAIVDGADSEVFVYGQATDDGAPVGADTIFEIGSTTKLFTALALAAMTQREQVALDEPVAALLPEGTGLPAGGGERITLLDLATHYSGLPRLPENFAPADLSNPYADYDAARLYAYLADATLQRAPGVEYEYSNVGFGLLGHALGLRAERDYAALVAAEVAEPLGMTDTSTQIPESKRDRMATGHNADGESRGEWDFDVLAPAGSIRSTLHDMILFTQAALGEGAAALSDMFADSMAPRRAQPEGMIGLAWHITAGGVTWHNGETGGYHSYLGLDRARQLGVVMLTPTASPVVVDRLGTALVELAQGRRPAPLDYPKSVTLDPEALDEYLGSYVFSDDLVLDVWREADVLRGRPTDEESFRLWPTTGKDQFYLRVVPYRIAFERSPSGEITALILAAGDERTRAPRR